MTSTVYYAIGDIHGEAEKLAILHGRIERRHARDYPGRKYVLVHLGDYIDRGPESYDVVERIMNMESNDTRTIINLKGNHEQIMLANYTKDDFKSHHFWMDNGGRQTLDSYRRAGFDAPPKRHLEWMKTLETYHWDKAAKLIFVHAGIDPAHFPNDGEDRHLWTRAATFFETETWDNPILKDVTVIHGHTPTDDKKPEIDGGFRRINIDTGACYGGALTAVILAAGEVPKFLSV